jgi:hypothetical protein
MEQILRRLEAEGVWSCARILSDDDLAYAVEHYTETEFLNLAFLTVLLAEYLSRQRLRRKKKEEARAPEGGAEESKG